MDIPPRPVVRSHLPKIARPHVRARLAAAAMLGILGYAVLTPGVSGPVAERVETLPAPVAVVSASLSYSGTDPIITGSVGDLFAAASFTGPNRAAKTDRIRPPVNALAFSSNFAEARTRLAALRAPAEPALGQTRFADIEATGDVEIGPRMSVAALNPSAAAALDAIAGIAPAAVPETPMPAQASEQLAYARETAPVTGGFATGEAVAASDKELWCLSTAIYFEARGESYRGQVAVAQVVLNRVKDHRYPGTICGVVFQNQSKRNACQFSFACDGIPESVNDDKSWAQAEDIARRFTDGQLYLTEVADATHYHATYVRPAWAPRMTKLTQIGLHVFYRFKNGWLFG